LSCGKKPLEALCGRKTYAKEHSQEVEWQKRQDHPIIDSDGHVRRPMSKSWNICLLATVRGGRRCSTFRWCRIIAGMSIPANDFRQQDFRVPDWREWAGSSTRKYRPYGSLSDALHAHRSDRQSALRRRTLPRLNDFLHEQFLTQDRRFRGMALLPLKTFLPLRN
jgi:hypothetical protein